MFGRTIRKNRIKVYAKNVNNCCHVIAHYEILDIIKTELQVRGEDLKDYGLDINLEEIFFALLKGRVTNARVKNARR